MNSRAKIFSLTIIILAAGFIGSNLPVLQGSSGHQAYDRGLEGQATSALGYNTDVASSGAADSASPGSRSDRKIITTVRMTLDVSSVSSAMTLIESDVDSYNGFIESSSISRGEGNTGRMTVAVPSEDLDRFESGISDSWEVESRDVDREDVTDSYNELEAEIESLRTEYSRLQELINQTDDVENLIKIQERMSEVRGKIDYKQQRIERMDENIEYSKVHITLEGPKTFESRFGLRDTLSSAYSALFRSLELMILGGAYLLPVAALYGLYRLVVRLKEERF